jgi:hypothetical protein
MIHAKSQMAVLQSVMKKLETRDGDRSIWVTGGKGTEKQHPTGGIEALPRFNNHALNKSASG